MRCKAPRKGPRRRAAKPTPVDDELFELAAVIAEYRLDNNAANWFKPPWRDGWNAVELAYAVSMARDGWLATVCANRVLCQEVYWGAQDRLSMTATPDRLMRAALRCLQVLIAKSDGGGEVYNAVLLEPFAEIYPEMAADQVMEYRCRDSIGTTAELQGDANDRLRRAFSIAWKRGLYLAAYSLPPATVAGQLKVVR